MPLKEVLHNDRLDDRSCQPPPSGYPAQEFRFIRTDTHNEEVIDPPTFDDDRHRSSSSSPKRGSFFHRHSHSPGLSPTREKSESRLSNLLHIDRPRSRRGSATSLNIPPDLPQIQTEHGDTEEREAQWEKRATTLIQENPRLASPSRALSPQGGPPEQRSRSRSNSRVNDPEGDVGRSIFLQAIRAVELGVLTSA